MLRGQGRHDGAEPLEDLHLVLEGDAGGGGGGGLEAVCVFLEGGRGGLIRHIYTRLIYVHVYYIYIYIYIIPGRQQLVIEP